MGVVLQSFSVRMQLYYVKSLRIARKYKMYFLFFQKLEFSQEQAGVYHYKILLPQDIFFDSSTHMLSASRIMGLWEI